MCGIIGFIGKKNAIQNTIEGLKKLEYRGYDSAGIAYIENNKIKILKAEGKIINLEQKLPKIEDTKLAIGHTRWATHGKPSEINSHPHKQGKITLVHNGIIENYQDLKEQMIKEGYIFQSDTDTEIAAATIDHIMKQEHDIIKTLTKIEKVLKGSYAFGIIVDEDYSHLYALRKDSPLIIGVSDQGKFIASDVPAITKYTNKYILLENNEIAVLTETDITVYKKEKKINKEVNTYNFGKESTEKDGYEHYMLKEINEQKTVVKKMINKYLNENLLEEIIDISKYKSIHIVACGSAYNSALIGKYLIEEYGNIPVYCEIASEYRYKKEFINKETLVIAISQSGETADTLASVRIAKENGATTLGIINVKGSSIARETDSVIYIEAGPEIAVATTKAYTMQILVLTLLAAKIAIKNQTLQIKEIKENLIKLPELINIVLDKNYKDIAKDLYNEKDIYFLGRNIDYALALEGCLKLKEISYIHSETYAAGELKHGSIALIEKNTKVISIITEESIREKTISNIKEVKARGAYNIIITNKKDNNQKDYADTIIVIPNAHKLITPILAVIPMQLIAYHVATMKNLDVDKPRNLAKSVTVE